MGSVSCFAGVAELVYACDQGSYGLAGHCGFESRHSHHSLRVRFIFANRIVQHQPLAVESLERGFTSFAVGHLASIESKIEFRQVAVKVLLAHVMKRAIDAALE